VKRFLDFVLAAVAFLAFGPIIIILAVLVYFNLGAPVLFKQERPGLDGVPFRMLKFRSMRNELDSQGNTLPDSERLTPLGKFIRSTSLDELPGLLNVLRGDMSLVGPRPLLVEYLTLYSTTQARRHEVRPGITGWAQVNGRNAISWEEKFELDVWYVDNQSLWLDIKILFLTVKKVLIRDGIAAEGEATMTRFVGSNGSKQ
jgi:lipopolysaccharide/colanic/teichoic acid biosynthesis glycosyltransferase